MCSEVLVVKGEMHPPGHKVMVPLNWKLRLPLDYFRLLIPLNQEAEKEVTVQAGMTNPSYQTGTEVVLYDRTKITCGIQDIHQIAS